MSRFEDTGDGEGLPWPLWENVVSSALGGRKGQTALAEMESALLALPERKLIEGNLAADGGVCAIGALVAHKRSEENEVDIQTVIDAMCVGVQCWCGHSRLDHGGGACSGTRYFDKTKQCNCTSYDPQNEDPDETAMAGQKEGISYTVAWHLAYLNDEKFASASPEERYTLMLAWVRRAQGKADEVAAPV